MTEINKLQDRETDTLLISRDGVTVLDTNMRKVKKKKKVFYYHIYYIYYHIGENTGKF